MQPDGNFAHHKVSWQPRKSKSVRGEPSRTMNGFTLGQSGIFTLNSTLFIVKTPID
jgi:hypothetical protein